MSRQVVALTLDNLTDLPDRCRACAFWELDPAAAAHAGTGSVAAAHKEAWLSDTLLEWGSCGRILYVDGRPAGHILYAPAPYVPRSTGFATSPVAPDAILLITANVRPEFAGGGLGRVLVQTVARDIVTRGIRAIEAFGRTTGAEDRGRRPGDAEDTAEAAAEPALVATDAASRRCLLPADYLRAVGFKTVRPHPLTPRLRLDIRSTVTWREDVESVLERLMGTIHAPVLSR